MFEHRKLHQQHPLQLETHLLEQACAISGQNDRMREAAAVQPVVEHMAFGAATGDIEKPNLNTNDKAIGSTGQQGMNGQRIRGEACRSLQRCINRLMQTYALSTTEYRDGV